MSNNTIVIPEDFKCPAKGGIGLGKEIYQSGRRAAGTYDEMWARQDLARLLEPGDIIEYWRGRSDWSYVECGGNLYKKDGSKKIYVLRGDMDIGIDTGHPPQMGLAYEQVPVFNEHFKCIENRDDKSRPVIKYPTKQVQKLVIDYCNKPVGMILRTADGRVFRGPIVGRSDYGENLKDFIKKASPFTSLEDGEELAHWGGREEFGIKVHVITVRTPYKRYYGEYVPDLD